MFSIAEVTILFDVAAIVRRFLYEMKIAQVIILTDLRNKTKKINIDEDDGSFMTFCLGVNF